MRALIAAVTGAILYLVILVVPILAWITHVVKCLDTDRWGFLIAGAILAPIGVIHGIGIWLGVW